jgi:hypothetical protein
MRNATGTGGTGIFLSIPYYAQYAVLLGFTLFDKDKEMPVPPVPPATVKPTTHPPLPAMRDWTLPQTVKGSELAQAIAEAHAAGSLL